MLPFKFLELFTANEISGEGINGASNSGIVVANEIFFGIIQKRLIKHWKKCQKRFERNLCAHSKLIEELKDFMRKIRSKLC